MTARRVGIRDVAAAAGVSVTTVSHALNGKGRLPPETRTRIQRIATELNYRPNAVARSLAGGKTGLLALVTSSNLPFALTDFAYFTRLMTGAATAALDAGYALVLVPPDRDVGVGDGLVVDGAILVDPVRGDPTVEALRGSGLPLVTTGRLLDDADRTPWVDNDHPAALREVLDHLHGRGARAIALLSSPTEISYTLDQLAAYRAWCADRGLPELIKLAGEDITESAGFAATSQLLTSPTPPDAIFASYDRLAFGALMAARAAGKTVPADLQIAMTATESGAGQPREAPSLSSLDLDPGAIGLAAAELLVSRVERRDDQPSHVVIPTSLRLGAEAPAR